MFWAWNVFSMLLSYAVDQNNEISILCEENSIFMQTISFVSNRQQV